VIAAGTAPEPSRTLAILFGASRWPEFSGLDSVEAASGYTTAADAVRSYLLGTDGLGLPTANFKDLFDSNDDVLKQDKAIRDFIKERSASAATIQDLIVIYVGHGSTMQGGKFIFILRSTNRDQRDITAYKSETLGRTVKETAPLLRKWILLDCCAAQAAFGDFLPASPVEDVLEKDAETSFPPDGAAFYAACSADNFAYNDSRTGGRMFTAALIQVLKDGASQLGERLTLSEVASLVKDEIVRRNGPDSVIPWIGNPDARRGELTLVPFFPNAKRRRDALAEKVAAIEKAVADITHRLKVRDEVDVAQKADVSASASRQNDPVPRREHTIANLTNRERRYWDEAQSGHSVGIAIFAAAFLLLAMNAAFYLFLVIEDGSAPVHLIHILQRVIGVGALVLAIPSLIACKPSPNKSDDLSDTSPALTELLARDDVFRRVYQAHYGNTPIGPVHRRMAAMALGLTLLAAIPSLLTLVPEEMAYVGPPLNRTTSP
jgi:hypothetical protein